MTRNNRRRGFFSTKALVVIFFWAVILPGCKQGRGEQTPSPPTVEVIEVIQKDVPVYSEWVASTDGFVNATIRAQVEGYLIKQNYREGDFIKKGQVLFEIDPRTFEATVNQARATRNKAQATLEQTKADVARAEAQYANSKANLNRVKPLAEVNAVSKKDLDDALNAERSAHASLVAAQASVEASRASLFATEAALEKAQLDLGFTYIVSPIGGIAGIAKAQIGNLVGPGSVEELTTVSTVDPIKVYISMSEQEYLKDMQNGWGRTGQVPLELILADGSIHPHKGRFAFADRQVDGKTGTIKVAALFSNPGNFLRPGQFSRIRAKRDVEKGALLIPQRAVMELQVSYQVAVVGSDNMIDIRTAKVGQRIDNLWVIKEGLKPAERVVVEGIQKVKQGMAVNPIPYVIQAEAKLEGSESKTKKR